MIEIAPGVVVDPNSTMAWWLEGRYNYRIQYGGRGSGKTYDATEAIVAVMLSRKTRILNIRAVQKSLKDSIRPEIVRWINWRNLHDHFDVQDARIVCKRTEAEAIFHGADTGTVESLRSIASGIGICYIDEAHQIKPDVWRILEPSLRPSMPGEHTEIWCCFNPRREDDPVWRLFVQQRKGEAEGMLKIKERNWRDNPFFPAKLNVDRLHDKRNLPRALYEHIWEGRLHPGETKHGWYPLLTRRAIRACMDRDWWARRPEFRAGRPTLGHDVGEPDTRNNAVAVRHGPVIEWAEKFGSESWDGIGRHCKDVWERYDVNHAFIDSTGVGQGAISQYDVHGMRHRPVMFGGAPKGKNRRWLPRTTNEDMFQMRNAQLAWVLKLRVENTWRASQGEQIDPALCLWINPDIPEPDLLVSECAQPIWTKLSAKRVKLDKYGGDENPSPDLFDALCLALAMDSASGLRAADWNLGDPGIEEAA